MDSEPRDGRGPDAPLPQDPALSDSPWGLLLAEVRPDGAGPLPEGSLRDWGLSSLALTRLWLGVRRAYDVDLELSWLGDSTAAQVLERLEGEPRATVGGSSGAVVSGGRGVPGAAEQEAHLPFPLTPLQQAYVLARQEGVADPAGCHLYREFRVRDLDPARLERAWRDMVSRHDMLRAVIDEDGTQRVRPAAPEWRMTVHDVSARGAVQAGRHREETRRRMSHQCYRAGAWPLFAVESSLMPGGDDLVHFSLDTIVTDAHGFALLLQQWHERYLALATDGESAPPPAPDLSPRACVLALEAERSGEAYAADTEYWTACLADCPGGPDIVLPAGEPARESVGTGRGKEADGPVPRRPLDGELDPAEWRGLRALAQDAAVSPTALVLSLFAEALVRAGATAPFSLVVTTGLRPWLPRAADVVVGPFTSTVVHTVTGTEEPSVREAARVTNDALGEQLRHGLVSGVEAARALRARRGVQLPDQPVVFTSLLDVGPGPGVAGGFGADVAYGVSQTSGLALDHQMWEQDGGLRFRWDVDDARFATGVVDTAFAAFRNALGAAATSSAGVPADDTAPVPLRDLQQAYVVDRVVGGAAAEGCQCYQSYRIDALDLDRLSTALRRLVADHDVLRGLVDGPGFRVRSAGTGRWHIPVIDLPGPDEDDARVLARVREEMTLRPFPLGRWPLFDVRVTRDTAGRCTVHCAFDLLVGDGRTIHLLFRELWRMYADPDALGTAHGTPAAGRTDTVPLAAADTPRAARHWQERLAALPPGPVLPSAPGRHGRTRLSGSLTGYRTLARRAATHGLTVDDLLLAALFEALSGQVRDSYAVCVVLWPEGTDRRRPAEESFLTWLAAPPPGTALLAAARAARRQFAEDLGFPGSGGIGELRRLSLKDRTVATSYPVVHTGLVDLTGHPLPPGVTQGEWFTSTPGCALDSVSVVDGDTLHYAWDLADGVLPDGLAGKLFDLFERGLREALDEPEQEVLDLPDDVREAVLYRWNATATSLPDDGPVQVLFERCARHSPAAVAVRGRRGPDLSYGELNRRANGIAWRLREHGVEPQDVVAVRTSRGPDMVAAVYGVLKAGAAYLPVDTALPAARVAAMLSLAGVRTLLTGADTPPLDPAGRIENLTVVTVHPDGGDAEHPRAGENPAPVALPDHTAYVIFTSGSTGVPKGVDVAHRSVRNLLAFCAREFGPGPQDTGLAVTSVGFDLSVFDLFGLLGHGAAVYIADEEEQRDPQLLADALSSQPITIWNSAPTTLHQLIPLRPRHGVDPRSPGLRLVLLSGDFIPPSLPGRLAETFPGVRTVALGGPTETTVWSNIHRVEEMDPAWRAVPYGHPIDNTRHYVLDDRLRPCAPGVEGDLYTAGVCLAVGYRGDPDRTIEQFVPDPYTDEPSARMFCTGDRALWDAHGLLHIRGRADDQVKIRGHRVELGEIEHCLRAHPDVRDAVVQVRRGTDGDSLLVAYAIPERPGAGDGAALRAHVARALPSYMVPNFVAFLSSFPATDHGKLDRKALPWPLPGPAEKDTGGQTTEAPAGEEPARDDGALAQEIAGLFGEVLGGATIDVTKDLWDQGVTSFTMVQVSARLKERYGQRVPVAALVSDATVDGIARVVGERVGRTAPGPGPATTVDRPLARVVAPEPEPVDLFSPTERDAFKAAGWNLRPADVREPGIALPDIRFEPETYAWRGCRRDFLDRPLPAVSLARLLALLRGIAEDGVQDGAAGEDRVRHLYPSAGSTYAVQTYVHLREGAVTGLAEGVYYYHPHEHRLHLVNAAPRVDRGVHFPYNRPVFDRAGLGIYLVGQTRGIAPLYQEVSERFLLLEAGYMGQLLMTGQAACGIGLCPVGTLTFDAIRDQFALDDGHVLLHAFMGGPVEHTAAGAAPFAEATVRHTSDSGTHARNTSTRPRDTGAAGPDVDEIAVTGMAGRFPGAADPDEYWRHLSAGHHTTGPAPGDRTALVTAPPGSLPAKVNGGFLHRPERFDGGRFGISPAEAATLDPQLRLLLETVWSCLEDAGHTPDSLRAAAPRVGVFTAAMWHDHQLVGADAWAGGAEARISALASDIPSRISHFYRFEGPSLAVDTSCSSSLTALHLASESLRRGECDAALVGAVNLILHPYHLAALSAAGLLAETDGPVRAFGADGSGWIPGEGAAAVLLRPAAAAHEGRDVVHGLLESTWVGHYGGRGRYGRPDPQALAGSLATALDRAGVTPGDIGYVECAAAGAGLADAAELSALADVFAVAPTLAGTVKPNIGHLEAASGLSQLLKVLLQLRHGRIAPTLLAEHRSPLVDWAGLPLRIPERLTEWPSAVPRALVNAVGASGSYAHAVLRGPDHGDEHRGRRP